MFDRNIFDRNRIIGIIFIPKAREREKGLLMRKTDGIWFRLKRAFINPFTVILGIIALISFLTEVVLHQNSIRNGVNLPIILSMLLLSGSFRFVQELRAKRVAERLLSLTNTAVQAFRDGKWQGIKAEELVIGDTVRLCAGDRVPADLSLTKASDLFVSQSALTGESAVFEKKAAPQENHVLFMGSAIVGGSCEGTVTAVGKGTRYGDIQKRVRSRKSGFDRGADSIAWVLIRFMAVLVPFVFLAVGLTKGNWISAFLFALSVAVGLTPEMLPMVVNACLIKGSSAMEKKATVVKNINAMQGFGSMDILCVDKTGTLTGDRLQLEYYMDILGNESGIALDFAYLNSLYHTGAENPLDRSVLFCGGVETKRKHFEELGKQYRKLDELPFDYERRFDSVLVSGGGEHLLLVKGSVEKVLSRCRFVEYRGERTEICGKRSEGAQAVVGEMQQDGMKVLAVAYKNMGAAEVCTHEDETELVLLGYLGFFDAPKKSAESALRKLRDLHVDVKVLTGDQRDVAASVCRRLGLDTENLLTGQQLERCSEEERLLKIEHTAVFAELSPQQKASVVEALRGNGHTVGFLGDGLNDLPAVIEADVGISVDTAAEAVQESADVILLKKDLNVLEQSILEGRKSFANMAKYIRITASSNFGNILSIVIAGIFLPFLPMTAVQLLLLNLLYDILCLVLPWDPVDADIYSLPREWSGKNLGRFMRCFGPVSSVFDLLTFGFLFFVLCPAVCGGSFAEIVQAAGFSAAEADSLLLSVSGGELQSLANRFITLFQTGWFLESMWTQVLILYFLRTKKLPLLQSRPSWIVILITACGILFFTAVTYTPVGAALGLAALPFYFYGFLAAVVVLYALLVTAVKSCYVRKYHELI